LVRFQEHLSHLIGLGVTKKSQATETYYQLSAFEKVLRQAQNDDEEGKGESRGKKEREGEEGEEGERKGKRDSATKKDHSGKTKREKKSSLEKEISTPSISGRLIHRSKWIKNKRVDQYSAEHLREILGSFPENKV
jgi:hypothetical protein